MVGLTPTPAEADVTAIVADALDRSGAHSTRRATNLLFQRFTGIDPYALPDILIRDAAIHSAFGAKHLRDQLAQLLHIRLADAGALLGASESRFSRNDNLDKEILDRAHAIIDTYVNVATALGPEGAAEWFNTPHHTLDNETPIALLKTTYGRNLVNDLISAALAGSYT